MVNFCCFGCATTSPITVFYKLFFYIYCSYFLTAVAVSPQNRCNSTAKITPTNFKWHYLFSLSQYHTNISPKLLENVPQCIQSWQSRRHFCVTGLHDWPPSDIKVLMGFVCHSVISGWNPVWLNTAKDCKRAKKYHKGLFNKKKMDKMLHFSAAFCCKRLLQPCTTVKRCPTVTMWMWVQIDRLFLLFLFCFS